MPQQVMPLFVKPANSLYHLKLG